MEDNKFVLTFDSNNPNWSPNNEYNKLYIQSTTNFLTDLMYSRGHLFLNEVYDALGYARTREGVLQGWLSGNGAPGIKARENEGFPVSLELYITTDGDIHDRI